VNEPVEIADCLDGLIRATARERAAWQRREVVGRVL